MRNQMIKIDSSFGDICLLTAGIHSLFDGNSIDKFGTYVVQTDKTTNAPKTLFLWLRLQLWMYL